jgi:hypothetical protein
MGGASVGAGVGRDGVGGEARGAQAATSNISSVKQIKIGVLNILDSFHVLTIRFFILALYRKGVGVWCVIHTQESRQKIAQDLERRTPMLPREFLWMMLTLDQ